MKQNLQKEKERRVWGNELGKACYISLHHCGNLFGWQNELLHRRNRLCNMVFYIVSF